MQDDDSYRFLAESMPQIVWTALPDGRLDYVNQVLARYIGKSVEAALGAGWHEIVHPDDLLLSTQRWAHSIQTGEPYEVEHRVRRADGAYRWFLARATPRKDASGAVLKWFGTSTDVDDLKTAQRALQASEERFRTAQELSLQGFAIFRAVREGGRVVDFVWAYRNPAAAGLAEASGDFIGKRLLAVMPETRGEAIFGRYRRVCETGVAERFEVNVPPSGRWYNISVTRLGDGVAISYDEITPRKRAEEERALRVAAERRALDLAEAQRRHLQQLFAQAPVAISVLRGQPLVYEIANAPYCELVGKAGLPGRVGREALPELVDQGIWDALDAVVQTGQPFVGNELPVKLVRAGRLEQGFFNFIAEATLDDEGGRDGVLIVAAEVTALVLARKKAEELAEAVGNQQRWLEAVLDQMPTPLLLIEPGTGRQLFANRAVAEVAGGSFEPASNPADYARYVATDPAGDPLPVELMPALRAARGEILRGEQIDWHTGKGKRSLLVHSSHVPQVHGHEPTAVLAFLDVTALKEAEQKLQEAVRVRDEFLSIASHELNTPLTALKLHLASLRRAAQQAGLRERAEKAERSANRLALLVEQLLDVSRITAGKLRLEREPVELGEVVRDVAARFGEVSAGELRLALEPQVTGEWDRFRLEQVVTNLLSNAVKYGEGKAIEVSARGLDGQRVQLVVRDQGIGIEVDKQARLFGRFERAVSARNFGGFGLGLWIVRQIVEAHGGSIALESEPGRGATFTVELPVRPQ